MNELSIVIHDVLSSEWNLVIVTVCLEINGVSVCLEMNIPETQFQQWFVTDHERVLHSLSAFN